MRFRLENPKGGEFRPPFSWPVVWTVCLCATLAACSVAQNVGRPKMQLSQEVWDFGTIRRGEQVRYQLILTNVGQDILYINQIRSSCTTCSVIEGYRKELKPGDSTEVKVTFKAEGRKGRVTKTIYIDTNDPAQPRTVFRITGIVQKSKDPEIVVDPNPWYPDSITTDPKSEGTFIVTNDGLSDLMVKKIETAGCVAQQTRLHAVRPGDSASVRVGFDIRSITWDGERYVLFRSNDPYQPALKVKIYGEASGDTTDTTPVCMLIFLTEECPECAYVMDEIITPLKKLDRGLQIQTISITPENYEILTDLEKRFKDTDNQIPVLFIDTYVLGGRKEIEAHLENRIQGCQEKGGCEFPECKKTKREGETRLKQPVHIAYFYQPGCKQCDRVDYMLQSLKERYEKLNIKEFNILKRNNIELNESVGELLGIPANRRLITPALVIGDKYFVQQDITDERVRSAIEGFRDTGSMCSWKEAQKLQAEARMSIIDRFEAFGPMTVVLGGFVDGINPCAFATIIFFLSYLAFIGRKGKDLLYVGVAFTAAVFLTYLFIGLGFYHFIQSLKFFNLVSMIIYVLTAALAFILGAYSVYDMIKIKRGRASDITLQLPDFLKKRIHRTIREKARMRRYVLAAFITGWIVSLLELACTGQVYLPTICFVTGVPGLRLHAFLYLVVYNLMFIFPLCFVFGLTYYGTSSEQIAGWMKRHIIMMKTALAVFFFCLGGFLLSVIF